MAEPPAQGLVGEYPAVMPVARNGGGDPFWRAGPEHLRLPHPIGRMINIVALLDMRVPGMQPHPHPQRGTRRPRLGRRRG